MAKTRQTSFMVHGREFKTYGEIGEAYGLSLGLIKKERFLNPDMEMQELIEFLIARREKTRKERAHQDYIKAKLKEEGISLATFRSRIQRGWSEEEALKKHSELHREGRPGKATLYKGVVYSSAVEAQQAKANDPNPVDGRTGKSATAYGREFKNKTDLFTRFNVPLTSYRTLLKKGYSIEEVLEKYGVTERDVLSAD